MEMKAEDLKIDGLERNPVGKRTETKSEIEKIADIPKFVFSPSCPVCSMEDTELQKKIHHWKFVEKKTYTEIQSLVEPMVFTEDMLDKHFHRHFPVKKETNVEVLSPESKLRAYYEEQVEARVKPVVEMEKLYEKIANWFDIWEAKQVKDDKKSLKNSDVEPLVRLSSELKTLLVELNKMRQAEAMAKICVQGFMTRFIKVLLHGLEEVMENLLVDLQTKYDDDKEIADMLKKTKTGLARQIKDGAREALIATVQEYGLRG